MRTQAADTHTDPITLFTAHRPQIAARARHIGRRQGLPECDLDDFVSDVMVKLIEGDYAALRAFRGRSRVLTYVTTVIIRLAKDECNRRWGKWRPSAEALRLGLEAMTLERLLCRDEHSYADAERRMLELFPRLRALDVERLAGRLPPREKRRFAGEEALEAMPADDSACDAVTVGECEARKRRVLAVVRRGLETLDPAWRQALSWRYERGWPAAEIARGLGTRTRDVYRILEKSKRRLRRFLEGEGIDAHAALADVGADFS